MRITLLRLGVVTKIGTIKKFLTTQWPKLIQNRGHCEFEMWWQSLSMLTCVCPRSCLYQFLKQYQLETECSKTWAYGGVSHLHNHSSKHTCALYNVHAVMIWHQGILPPTPQLRCEIIAHWDIVFCCCCFVLFLLFWFFKTLFLYVAMKLAL